MFPQFKIRVAKHQCRPRAVAALWVLLLLRCVHGQTPTAPGPEKLPPGVDITVQAEPQKAAVGDLIQINFDVTVPEGVSVEIPDPGAQVGDFSILESFLTLPPGPGNTSNPSQDAARHHRARLIVAVYKTGEFTFPPIPIILQEAQGRKISTASPTVSVEIISVLGDKDTNLKELRKQAEIQGEPEGWPAWPAITLGAILLGAVLWWLWRRRRHRPVAAPAAQPLRPQMDPLDLAETELRDLIRRGLLESGGVKQFYIALSDIVKRILEAGYNIQTIERTTAEIVEALERNGAGPSEKGTLAQIASLLLECDMVKFAKYIPSRAESDVTVEKVYQVLRSCKRLSPTLTSMSSAAGAL